MTYPNTAPVTRAEKGWGLVIAILSFPVGLIAFFGLLANQGWARWVGLVLGVVIGALGVAAAIWLVAVFLPGPGASYPFGPWFVFIAGLATVLGLLAARAFLRGLRATEA